MNRLESLTEGLIWWVILAAIALMNLEMIDVADETSIYIMALIVGAFNFFWHHLLPRTYSIPRKIYWELLVQILFVAGLVNLTGGIESNFYFVYVLPLITSAIALENKVVWQVTGLVCLLTLAEAVWGFGRSGFPTISLKLFALATVGAYSGSLSRLIFSERGAREEATQRLLDQARHMTLIHKTSSLINLSPDIKETLPLMAKEAKKALPFEFISIAVPSNGGEKLEVLAAEGYPEDGLCQGFTCPIKGTVLETVMRRGEPLLKEGIGSSPQEFSTYPLLLKEGINSFISLPLIAHGEVLGSLNLATRLAKLPSPDYLERLKPMAEQVAMALRNYNLYQQVKLESITDVLTGLYNHRYFHEQLEIHIKREMRRGGCLSLLMADLDHFKLFNDTNGHVLGDEALKAVGEIIRTSVRAEDLAARYGGEEFVVLLSGVDTPRAQLVAERLRRRVEAYPFKVKPETLAHLTMSMGIASFPRDAHSREGLVKKADQALFMAKARGRNRVCIYNPEEAQQEAPVEELLQKELSLGIIQALAAAVDAKDPYTYRHSETVARYAVALARKINLTAEEIEEARMAGLLHDVGKIGIADEILRKRGRLTDEEWKILREHPVLSHNIVRHVPSLHPILPAILHHHERFDGNGYPGGLEGEEIPLMARILYIADAYHAMISDRAYRPALRPEEAVEQLKANVGKQFDPLLVEAFITLLPL